MITFFDVIVLLPNIVCFNIAGLGQGELQQKDLINLNPEYKVSTRRRHNLVSKDQVADSSQIQSKTPRDNLSLQVTNCPLVFH